MELIGIIEIKIDYQLLLFTTVKPRNERANERVNEQIKYWILVVGK